MFGDVSSPFGSVEEMSHPLSGKECLIAEMAGTEPRRGMRSTVDERIALNGKRFRRVQVDLTVVFPALFPDNPLAALKAELRKTMFSN